METIRWPMKLPEEIIVEHCGEWGTKHTLRLTDGAYTSEYHCDLRDCVSMLSIFEDADTPFCAIVVKFYLEYMINLPFEPRGTCDRLQGSKRFRYYILSTTDRHRIVFHDVRYSDPVLGTTIQRAIELPGGMYHDCWLAHQKGLMSIAESMGLL